MLRLYLKKLIRYVIYNMVYVTTLAALNNYFFLCIRLSALL